mmetsp:Transcript_10792/g.26918  ORF Transcript_10792/g.26918 Transcript_10792/m.26918 type:complete len:353 (-) Transcript_10792:337-1395(-)
MVKYSVKWLPFMSKQKAAAENDLVTLPEHRAYRLTVQPRHDAHACLDELIRSHACLDKLLRDLEISDTEEVEEDEVGNASDWQDKVAASSAKVTDQAWTVDSLPALEWGSSSSEESGVAPRVWHSTRLQVHPDGQTADSLRLENHVQCGDGKDHSGHPLDASVSGGPPSAAGVHAEAHTEKYSMNLPERHAGPSFQHRRDACACLDKLRLESSDMEEEGDGSAPDAREIWTVDALPPHSADEDDSSGESFLPSRAHRGITSRIRSLRGRLAEHLQRERNVRVATLRSSSERPRSASTPATRHRVIPSRMISFAGMRQASSSSFPVVPSSSMMPPLSPRQAWGRIASPRGHVL